MPNLKYFSGTLILSDKSEDMNRINYGLLDLVTGEFNSITDELERIYNSKFNCIRIALRILDNGHLLNKMGALHMGEDKKGIMGWFINGLEFDRYLDELNEDGNRDIEIYIENFLYDTSTTEDIQHDTQKAM